MLGSDMRRFCRALKLKSIDSATLLLVKRKAYCGEWHRCSILNQPNTTKDFSRLHQLPNRLAETSE